MIRVNDFICCFLTFKYAHFVGLKSIIENSCCDLQGDTTDHMLDGHQPAGFLCLSRLVSLCGCTVHICYAEGDVMIFILFYFILFYFLHNALNSRVK